MNLKRTSIFLACWLAAGMVFAGETVSSFVQASLGFDIASVPFGVAASTNTEYQSVDAPLSPSPLMADSATSWKTNAVSGKYNKDFPGRVLRFGFRDERLVAARISISALSSAALSDPEVLNKKRQELIQIQDQLSKAGWTRALNTNDSRFRMSYAAMCSPTAESLFLMEFHIIPVESKSTSGP